MENSWDSNAQHDKAFERIKKCIKHVTEVTHFRRNAQLRIICDTNRVELNAVLEQREKNQEWNPIHFASKFLIEFEDKYSNIELDY